MRFPAYGLYAITPDRYPHRERLLNEVEAAISGGLALLQFRDKSGDTAWRQQTAEDLVQLCTRNECPLIINDDIDLALEINAAGVHLGEDDPDLSKARQLLGEEAIIGASCYNRLELGERAANQGASYLAFGSMYASSSKPKARSCSPEVISAAKALSLPLVAIGGITPDNVGSLVQAGADYVAVISSLFDAEDIQQQAELFTRHIEWAHEQAGFKNP